MMNLNDECAKVQKKSASPTLDGFFKRGADRVSPLILSVSHAESNGVQWVFRIVW